MTHVTSKAEKVAEEKRVIAEKLERAKNRLANKVREREAEEDRREKEGDDDWSGHVFV